MQKADRMHCATILYRELDHLQVLVSVGGPGTNPL